MRGILGIALSVAAVAFCAPSTHAQVDTITSELSEGTFQPGTLCANAFRLIAKDASGNPVQNVSVTLNVQGKGLIVDDRNQHVIAFTRTTGGDGMVTFDILTPPLGEEMFLWATAKEGGNDVSPRIERPVVLVPIRGEQVDTRENFEASIFTGVAIDSFAASELKKYINPDDSSDVRERGIGGFLIQYRLAGRIDRARQLWFYARTIHGMRSTDVDCEATPDVAVCKDAFDPVNAPERNLFILRNATSLEAYMGLRWEFKTLESGSDSPAALYFKAQGGFLSVSNGGGDVVDSHVIGFGVMAVGGPRKDSRIEVGYGRTDLFVVNRHRRIKIDGLVLFNGDKDSNAKTALGRKLSEIRPFAGMTVDADGRNGADSIQAYLGFAFDFESWSGK